MMTQATGDASRDNSGKMATSAVEKAFCVLELSKTNCVTVVRRRFRARFGKSPPARQSIYDWHKKFKTTACI
jgi:hypothetical protein